MLSPAYADQVRRQAAAESAVCRLAAVCQPGERSLTSAMAEVHRRQELGMSFLAAMESVTSDIAVGRWTP
jgi:hypothetical protein